MDDTPAPRAPTDGDSLERALAGLTAAVRALEAAHGAGTLERTLAELHGDGVMPLALCEPYERLARARSVLPEPRRVEAIESLLARASRELVHGDVRFAARLEAEGRSRGPQDFALIATSPRGEVRLRTDQVGAARAWGIAFDLADESENKIVDRYLARRAGERLASALVGIEKIQRRLAGRTIDGPLCYLPPDDGADFEQLLIDILNEHAPLARHAPLHEDFFEKTDLRVHLPGLERRRGARVQVTRSISPGAHAAKVESIRRVDEVVMLSPLSVVRALNGPAAHDLVGADGVARIWPLLPGPRVPEGDTARGLRDLLTAAMERRHAGPRGPLVAVPEPLRLLIQEYTVAEARRTTQAMRRRQAGA